MPVDVFVFFQFSLTVSFLPRRRGNSHLILLLLLLRREGGGFRRRGTQRTRPTDSQRRERTHREIRRRLQIEKSILTSTFCVCFYGVIFVRMLSLTKLRCFSCTTAVRARATKLFVYVSFLSLSLSAKSNHLVSEGWWCDDSFGGGGFALLFVVEMVSAVFRRRRRRRRRRAFGRRRRRRRRRAHVSQFA